MLSIRTRGDLAEQELFEPKVNQTPYRLHDCLHDIVERWRVRANKTTKELVISLRLEPNLPAVSIGDEVELRLILGHLIFKAIKFTNRGEISITAKTESQTRNAILLRLTVLARVAVRPRYKKREEPAKETGKCRVVGADDRDLGLALCSRLLTRMSGRIVTEIQPGISMSFCVETYQLASTKRDPGMLFIANLMGR